jgi:hypothetical protein
VEVLCICGAILYKGVEHLWILTFLVRYSGTNPLRMWEDNSVLFLERK